MWRNSKDDGSARRLAAGAVVGEGVAFELDEECGAGVVEDTTVDKVCFAAVVEAVEAVEVASEVDVGST